MLVTQGNSPITTTRVGTVMFVNKLSLLLLRMREGEELKAPRHASAAATRDDHVTTRDIVPTEKKKKYI